MAAPIDEDYEEIVSLQDSVEISVYLRDAEIPFLALVIEEPSNRIDSLKLIRTCLLID